ncbi:MAG: nucleoside deaminase [Cyanobacteriota bacterium]|jgi:tRNA(adenine34) deaminase
MLATLAPYLTPQANADHYRWLDRALTLAQEAGAAGDVPVGAVVVSQEGTVLAEAANRKQRDSNPVAHAEILALEQASRVLGTWHLETCRLYVTLEPCPMCAGALLQARLGLLVYGAADPKAGAIQTVLTIPQSAASHYSLPVIGGIREQACQDLLRSWFAQRRGKQQQAIG